MVVADEEKGGLGVVGDVADDVAEFLGGVYAAEGHEVVDVVDDDEVGFVTVDECLDVAVEGVDIASLLAEEVEADKVDAFLVGGVGDKLVVYGGAYVGAVEGVDPEDFAGGGCANRGVAGGGRGRSSGTGDRAGGNGLTF